jgi:hypothetical protein
LFAVRGTGENGAMATTPQFPLRIIYDDGEAVVIEEPEQLFDHFHTVDTTLASRHLWIRDDEGRTVHLRMNDGIIERLEV